MARGTFSSYSFLSYSLTDETSRLFPMQPDLLIVNVKYVSGLSDILGPRPSWAYWLHLRYSMRSRLASVLGMANLRLRMISPLWGLITTREISAKKKGRGCGPAFRSS